MCCAVLRCAADLEHHTPESNVARVVCDLSRRRYRPGLASTVRLNLFHSTKNLQNDGSMVHYFPSDQKGSVVEQNWAHSTSKKCYRFDDPYDGVNGTMRRNVCFKGGGFEIKGDWHLLSRNLAYDGWRWEHNALDTHSPNNVINIQKWPNGGPMVSREQLCRQTPPSLSSSAA